jgi:thymidylate synthase (FAD)
MEVLTMKVIDSIVEEIVQEPGVEGLFKQIEVAGRTCYKSEAKITKDSYIAFVEKMVKAGHYSMLEHGTVYLAIPIEKDKADMNAINLFIRNPYSWVTISETHVFVTTNLRVLLENFNENANEYWKVILDKFLIDPNKEDPDQQWLERRYTFRFTISRAISHEFVRHRVFSFAQESTRWINYNKKPLMVIRPSTWDNWKSFQKAIWYIAVVISGWIYNLLVWIKVKPEYARGILPMDLKTELVMTGTNRQWVDFLNKRFFNSTGRAHPDARRVALMVKEILGY